MLPFLLLISCVGCKPPVSSKPIGAPIQIHAPLGLPPVPIPKDNWPTVESIALGRRLFYETRLSKDNTLSCSSCHKPQSGFSDNRALSLGVGGTKGERHAPTLINVAYAPLLFWDGRVLSLEDQVGSPIANALEMNQTHAASVDKLKDDPRYKQMFLAAFGSEDVTMKRMENALASFERTILSGNSAFDRYEYEGKRDALTPAQIRGLTVFMDPARGNCAACHTVSAKSALFTDGKFHNTGEGAGDVGQFTDPGRFVVTKVEAERGAFKTPTLRNVALSGPYMHDGKLKTLKDVVDFYAGRGNSNENLDKRVAEIVLNGRDRSDLVEFLKALTGDMPPNVGPPEGK
jgi:cytochrome c peroxidase